MNKKDLREEILEKCFENICREESPNESIIDALVILREELSYVIDNRTELNEHLMWLMKEATERPIEED